VGKADVSLTAVIQPVGNPPMIGFEGAFEAGLPLLLSEFISASNGAAVIHVPGPAGMAVLGVGGLIIARRRRVPFETPTTPIRIDECARNTRSVCRVWI
jgi:hypothetical protein